MISYIEKIEEMGKNIYHRYSKILWFLYILAFVVISYRCFWFALDSSLDMQWYPTLHFWGLGNFDFPINPYFAFLSEDRFMANGPNYMPLLYILMYPFGLLEWRDAKIAFAFLNFCMFLSTIYILYKKSNQKPYVMLFSTLVILGFTYGNVVANAQTTIFIGFCIALAYYYRHNSFVLTIALVLVMIKHSVGIPILFGFFLAGFRKEVIYACILMLCFIFVSSWKFDTNPIDFVHMMLQVNALTYASPKAMGGPADLVSLSQKIFHKPYSIITCISVLICISMMWYVWKNRPRTSRIISASIVLSLVVLPHLGYDYYLLFIALLLAVEDKKMDFSTLFLGFLSLFLWRASFLKPWIDSISNKIVSSDVKTFWAMNMGIPFCVVIVACFVLSIVLLLRSDRMIDEGRQ